MKDIRYTLGIDIGIGSVGWAVLENDETSEPFKIEKLGVRIFDKAEQPKTGASLALPRREARSARRRLRRHKHRLERIRHLLEAEGIMSVDAITELYLHPHFEKDVYRLRVDALDRILDNEELTRVLIHIAQRRGYKSNSRSESVKDEDVGKTKIAISENMRLMKEKGYRTVGEMLLKDEKFKLLTPDGKVTLKTRNSQGEYLATMERNAVVSEIRLIFKRQAELGSQIITSNLEEKYLEIFESQRSFDEGPGGNSPFGGGFSVGYCTFEKDEPRAAKATYTFEYFKLLQDINHIKLQKYGGSSEALTPEQREKIISKCLKSSDVTYAKIRKELELSDEYRFNTLNYGDKSIEVQEKKKFSEMQSFHKIRTTLNKFQKDAIYTLSHNQLDEIGRILMMYKSDHNRIEALENAGIPAEFIPSLLELSFAQVGHLSVKAMKKIIPYLEEGKTYDKACAAIYGDHRRKGSEEKKTKLSIDDIDYITNPVVRRALAQSIKVVNAIVMEYGPPESVKVELAREISKNFEERKKIQKRQEENRAKNERAKAQIEEVKGDRATGLDIVKFKLWQEQDGICIYSGKKLQLEHLYDAGYADVDHIISYSISFDDSYTNKVLVCAEENRQKGNMIPYAYLNRDSSSWHEFEARVQALIRDYHKRRKLLKKSLSEEDIEGFKQRNLQDTQYISRVFYNLISNNLEIRPSNIKAPVMTVNGAITSQIRNRLGINKIREDGDLHHAADAAVIATVTPGMIQKITHYSKRSEYVRETTGGYLDVETGELMSKKEYDMKYSPRFPEPWPRFTKELEARLASNPRKEIDLLGITSYESDDNIEPVFVSRMPTRKITGAAHMETVRSGKKPGYAVTKTKLSDLRLKNGEIENYYNPISDTLLYNALKERLTLYDGNAIKAFAEPFYKPKSDGTPGNRVNKVKIYAKTTLNVPVNGGLAGNGSMVRIDVFLIKEDGYYLVPIYVADTVKDALPTLAVVGGKPISKWREMVDSDFLFSLYPGDLIKITHKTGITLSNIKGGSGDPTIERKELFAYYVSTDISTASITIETHDRAYSRRSLGIKTLGLIEKFQVDILGNVSKVRLPEKRMRFSG